MVKDKQTLEELKPVINSFFDNAQVLVAYNIDFDTKFLAKAGITIPICPHFDVMKEFAPLGGKWNNRHQDYTWVKLSECAEHYGYQFKAHDALEDTRATLYCFNRMISDDSPKGYLALVNAHAKFLPKSRNSNSSNIQKQSINASKPGTTSHLENTKNSDLESGNANTPIVKKRAYVLLAVFLGWIGAHDFYAHFGYFERSILLDGHSLDRSNLPSSNDWIKASRF